MAGQHDQNHERTESQAGRHTQSSRPGHEKRGDQLDGKHADKRQDVEPARKLRDPPTRPDRNGLGEVVEVQCRAFEPGIGARCIESIKFDDARLEHEAKEQPPDEPSANPRRCGGAKAEVTHPWDVEDNKQSRFKKQGIPLEVQKDRNGRGKGQVAEPGHESRGGGEESENEQGRGEGSEAKPHLQSGITRAKPKKARHLQPPRRCAAMGGKMVVSRGEVIGHWENAL